jgi:sterol desaturase/sphingolipid hydroxylase (fatty acid hydroxylase superfamily)
LVAQTILALALIGWFVLLAGLEVLIPARHRSKDADPDSRLVTNFGLGIVTLLLSSLLPEAKLGASAFAGASDLSLASKIALPWSGFVILLFIADSFAAYWTHRMMHALPIFWRIHRVHHADRRIDVSTGLRNHPLELIVTVPTSVVLVLAIGAPVSAVVVVQTIAFAAGIWQHADIDLRWRLSRSLNRAIVTPDLHRLHHSQSREEHDTNYGELLTLWDHLFGTFAVPRTEVRVGLGGQRARSDRLLEQIWSPLT